MSHDISIYLGLQKWALLFDKDQNLCQQVVTEELIATSEPSLQLLVDLEQIKSIFSVNINTENILIFIWKRFNDIAMQEGFVLMKGAENNQQLLFCLQWAYVIIKSHSSLDNGMFVQ